MYCPLVQVVVPSACVSPARANPSAWPQTSSLPPGRACRPISRLVHWHMRWAARFILYSGLTSNPCVQGDKVEGKVKEGFGTLTGDDSKKNEGKAQNASGDVQKTVTENVVDPIKGAAQYVSDTVTGNKK